MKTYQDQMAYANRDEILAKNRTSIRSYESVRKAQAEYTKSLHAGLLDSFPYILQFNKTKNLGHTFSDSVRCVYYATKNDYSTNFKDIPSSKQFGGLIRRFSDIPFFK